MVTTGKIKRSFAPLKMLFLLLFFFLSCGKNEHEYEPIPYVYVNIEMTLIDLKTVNERGWDTIPGGYKGILVHRLSPSSYVAYERACPYDPLEDCAIIEVEGSGTTLIDSCCFSRYLMSDGSVFSGPSLMPLKQYYTHFDGQRLIIRN